MSQGFDGSGNASGGKGGGVGWASRKAIVAAGITLLLVTGTVAGIALSFARDVPNVNLLTDFQAERSTHVFARNGLLLANLYHENRTWVMIDRIPVVVRDAFIATEDRDFYINSGVDFGGIIRAAWADWRHEPLQGASTITQQLVRAMYLSDRISLSRKIEEAILAIEITHHFTKDQILDTYLNLIYLGAGAYGVDAAAHTYFGTDVGHLTLPQAAMLAGLTAAPSDYSPFVSLKRARARQVHVLERMVASGFITPVQASAAARASLGLIEERPTGLQSYRFPYFTTYVVHVLEQTVGTHATFQHGLNVYTTLDPRIQSEAQRAVDWGLEEARAGGLDAHQAALVALRPSTGEILAMVGGRRFSIHDQFNRAWQARRQPGSSFKPYVFTAAIDSGIPPTATIDDDPVSYPMGDGRMWTPEDDDGRFLGPVTLRYALAQSRNVVAVKLAQQIGIGKVIQYAERMGVDEQLDANLSLALGTSGLTPLDQASGYATLANAGVHVDPSPLRVVRNARGTLIIDNRHPEGTEVVSAGTAYVMTSMLESVIDEGTGYPNALIGRPAAGKTGTTSDFRDAWFVGYTPDLVTAVWLGNDDDTPMNDSYGGNVPARIWARFMKTALSDTPKDDFVFPYQEVRRVALCSGKTEVFLNGTEPYESCGDYIRRGAASGAHLQPLAALPDTLSIDSPARAHEGPAPSPNVHREALQRGFR